MKYDKNKMAQKFGSVNRANLTLKEREKRTRTGAFKAGRKQAHGNIHKH